MKYTCLLSLFFILFACTQHKQNNRIISVSIEPLRYFTEQIGGTDFSIQVVVPPGASPETYEPTPSIMKTVSESASFISIGLLETELNIINNLKNDENINLIELYKNVDLIEGNPHHHHGNLHKSDEHSAQNGYDPHIWLSTKEALQISSVIRDELCRLNPDSCSKYQQNFNHLANEIKILDKYIHQHLDSADNRTFIIYHPALAYFCREYGFNQIAVESEGKEPSANSLKEIVSLARKEGIKTIFYQSQFSDATVKALAKEIAGTTEQLDPLAYNWLNNMYLITDLLSNKKE